VSLWRNSQTISLLGCTRSLSPSLGYANLGLRRLFLIRKRREAGDGPINKKPILPVEIMITVAINIVIAVLGYYVVMMWGLYRG
jgi:hypothetical protein